MDTLIIFTAQYLFLLAPLIALLAWWKLPKDKRANALIFTCASLLLSYLLALIARHFWYDPRPFVVSGLSPLIPHVADNGFPSDHTLLVASIAAVVSCMSRPHALTLWIIALLVGLARVAAGVHHASDIIGSIFIALIATLLVQSVLKWVNRV